MQRLTPDYLSHIEEFTIENDQTQMIWSNKRCVMPNEAHIPEYHGEKIAGPSLTPISIFSIQKAFLKLSCETKRSIIDLAMTMTNRYCESENQSWTYFNILLLQEETPARSNIFYLPLVNGNPS